MLLVDRCFNEGITLDANRCLIVLGIDYARVRLGICYRKKPSSFHEQLAQNVKLLPETKCIPIIVAVNEAYHLVRDKIKPFRSE